MRVGFVIYKKTISYWEFLVHAVDRALLVDTLPPSLQASGNAWAARMLGFGSVVGYFMLARLCHMFCMIWHGFNRGNVDLPRIFPFLGRTQLQIQSVVVCVLFLAGHLVMAALVKERVLLNNACAVEWVAFLLFQNIYKSTAEYPTGCPSGKSWRICGLQRELCLELFAK